MEIGGVIVVAGMELLLRPGDYMFSQGFTVSFVIRTVVGPRTDQDGDWLVLDGQFRPSETTPWRPRRILVRITSLKRALSLGQS